MNKLNKIMNDFGEELVQHPHTTQELIARFNLTQSEGDALRKRIKRITVNTRLPQAGEAQNEKLVTTVSKTDSGLEIESNYSGRILTIEQLIEAAQVDTALWKVSNAVVNKWEVGAKDARGNIVVEPLFQVKIWLERYYHIEIVPASGPAPSTPVVADSAENKSTSVSASFETAMFIPDMQIGYEWRGNFDSLDPFHDRQAIDVAQQFAAVNHPDYLIFLGDLLDFTTWSLKFNHAKQLKYVGTTQPAIEEAYSILSTFRYLCPRSKIIFIKGNHDIRPEKFFNNTHTDLMQIRPAQELAPPLTVERLLRLDELGIDYNSGYDEIMWLWDEVMIRHGEEYANLNAKKLAYSQVQGHVHSLLLDRKTVRTPQGQKVVTMMSPGCLCRIDGIVPAFSRNVDWQQGLGMAYYEKATKHVHMHVYPILEGTMFADNRMYKAKNPELLAQQAAQATGILKMRQN